jgi:hypothetical protein
MLVLALQFSRGDQRNTPVKASFMRMRELPQNGREDHVGTSFNDERRTYDHRKTTY